MSEMSELIFPPLRCGRLEVKGESRFFPVNRIFCVGRNYAAHAAEMGMEVDRGEPFFFTKSPSAFQPSGGVVPYPPGTQNYHYEVELVALIGAEPRKASAEEALDCVYGFACGLDMTRRDLQLKARDKGRPWDLGKDFEQSAVFAPATRAEAFGAIADQRIKLAVNGTVRQDAKLSDLIWRVDELIAHLSRFYRLQPGDAIMTGTPAGVGPLMPGDRMEGTIDGLDPVELEIVSAA